MLDRPGQPLRAAELRDPEPGPGQLLLEVRACGVCRTDLHIVDGELPHPKLPLVPGHQIVGLTEDGRRLGVPWLGWTDGDCRYCRRGLENLCDRARFTGYDLDGGYADRVVADEHFCLPIPDGYTDEQAAPLLCAGLIGYRSLRMAGDAERVGLYGFGASAHIVAQVARHEGRRVFAFTKPDDREGQAFARELGAEWAGGSDRRPPEELDAAILFAPAGELVPTALRRSREGRDGRLRRHPHERHPVLSVRAALGRAAGALGRQPDPGGRGGVPRARSAGAGADPGGGLPAGRGERGARPPSRRPDHGRRGPGALATLRRIERDVGRLRAAAEPDDADPLPALGREDQQAEAVGDDPPALPEGDEA